MHDTSVTNRAGKEENSNGCSVKSSHHKDDTHGRSLESVHNEPDTTGKRKLRSWLNKNLKIEMTDGRVLIGVFLCTDRDGNVILGSCCEYLKPDNSGTVEEPRVLGLVMVPGRHIVSVFLDDVASACTEVV